MKFLNLCLLIILCLLGACKDRSGNWTQKPPPPPAYEIDTNAIKSVSLIALIANPEKYHDKKIRVEGFFHSEFEGNELYLNTDDYIRSISKNAIWVDFKKVDAENFRKLSDHYVIIEGTFSSIMTGHDGANSGAVRNITRIDTIHIYPGRVRDLRFVSPKP